MFYNLQTLPPDQRPLGRCSHNDPASNSPFANQIRTKRPYNRIYYVVGVLVLPDLDQNLISSDPKDSDSRQPKWSPVDRAIVIATNKDENGKLFLGFDENYDIGLIFIPSIKLIQPINMITRYRKIYTFTSVNLHTINISYLLKNLSN